MNNTRALALAVLLVPATVAASACSADVLQFDDKQSQAVLDRSAIIAELGDAEARALCEWLPAYPGPTPPLPDQVAETSADYRIGVLGGSGCDDTRSGKLWTYMPLHMDDCVLNLRHAPCQATVGSLMDCLGFYERTFMTTPSESGEPLRPASDAGAPDTKRQCESLLDVCAALESAANCDETVIQNSFPTIVSDTEPAALSADCYALPIRPDAERPVCVSVQSSD